jgi:hypothetical protein
MTKLQKTKTSIKEIKTKLKIKKIRTTILKQKRERINVCFICHEREKKEKKNKQRWWQFDHHKQTRAILCGKGHSCAFRKMAKGQI